ncbi:MAG: choice-of-anchor D domain-containing protein [Phycisphaera sp.]|nr:choice-of-anchor D domain-containing protein [Phycisphaera sp.]
MSRHPQPRDTYALPEPARTALPVWLGIETLEDRLLLSGSSDGDAVLLQTVMGSDLVVSAQAAATSAAIYAIDLAALPPENGDINNPLTVNFTTEGITDWAQWGPLSFTGGDQLPPPYNHKAGVTSPISDLSDITGNGLLRGFNVTTAPNNLVRLQVSYTDGTPTTAVTDNEGFTFDVIPDVKGEGMMFHVYIPANAFGSLNVYANTYNGKVLNPDGTGKDVPVNLRAVFDDGTTLNRSDTLPVSPYDPGGAPGTHKYGSAHGLGQYTISFANASVGQNLTVYFTQDVSGFGSDRNIGLYGATLNIPGQTPQQVKRIADDRDPGWSTIGQWGFTIEPGRYYQDDHSFARGGGGANKATYTFDGLTPGEYRVSATWRADANRATNTPFSVFDGNTLLGTVRVNQELAPNTLSDAGFNFADIGTTWSITGSTLKVTLSDDANDYVDADAIRIERIGNTPPPPPTPQPEVRVLDGQTDLADNTAVVGLGATNQGTPVSRTFTVTNIGNANLTLGSIGSLSTGFTLTSALTKSTLTPGDSATFTVRLDATAVGNYQTAISFATNDSDENPFDFTVTGSVNTPPPPPPPNPDPIRYADDGDAGWATTGNWGRTPEAVYYGGDHSFAKDGKGANVASWTFTAVQSGSYRISATWRGDINRATNAPFQIYDGNKLLATVVVNQEQSPASLLENGRSWGDLLSAVDITSGTLTIKLSDNANEYVDADAIRIERLGDTGTPPPPPPTATVYYVDDRDAGWQSTGYWGFTNESAYYGSDHSYSKDGKGANVASWTLTGLQPGSYRVSATWRGDWNRATDTPFAVYDGSNLLTNVRVNQELNPNSLVDKGLNWGDLGGGVFDVTSGTLTVRISDDANEYVDADAIRVEYLGPATGGNHNQTVFYKDDREAGFTTTGTWGFTNEGVYYGGDHSFAQGGTGANTATYTFTDLTPGTYEIFATWRGDTNRANNTLFTVNSGSTTLSSVLVNQQLSPGTLYENGVWWGLIGTVTLTQTSLSVTLSDPGTTGYIDADAIRIERIV